MARGGAPSLRKDVTIKAPPAILRIGRSQAVPQDGAISDREIIQMQAALIKQLEGEVENQRMAASSIAVTTCCLIKAIVDETGVGVSDEGAVEIPREMYERLRGSQLEIQGWEKGNVGGVYARIAPSASTAPAIGGQL